MPCSESDLSSLGDGSHGSELAGLALLGGASPALGLLLPLLLLGEDEAHHLALVGCPLTLHLEELGLGGVLSGW